MSPPCLQDKVQIPLPALWTLTLLPTQGPHCPNLHLIFYPQPPLGVPSSQFCVFTKALPFCLSPLCLMCEYLLSVQKSGWASALPRSISLLSQREFIFFLLWSCWNLAWYFSWHLLHNIAIMCVYLCVYYCESFKAEVICSFIFISLVPGTSLETSKFSINCIEWIVAPWMGEVGLGKGGGTFCPELEKQKEWEEGDHLSHPKKTRKNENEASIFFIPWLLFKRKLSFNFFNE